jgi:hypothetical protein
MSNLETSNIDNTSHGITPPSTPPPVTPTTVTPTTVTPTTVTPDHTIESSLIYDSDSVAPVVSDIIEQTLVDLVKKYIENEDMKKLISISLTPEVTNIINNIISKSPNTLTDIEKTADEIIKDSKIDSKNIPNLIVIIQTIYQFIYYSKSVKLDTKNRAHVTATTLKFIIHLFVLEKRIKIEEDKQAEFFTQTDLLIDSCIGLLSFSKTLKTKGWFKSIFG